MYKYLKQYKLSHMIELLRNEKQEPRVCLRRCDGLYVAITGATSGVGREAAFSYAEKGARLLLINRNREKSEALCQELNGAYKGGASYLIADFSRLDQVKRAAREILESGTLPDIFIHNAGIFHTKYEETADGIESVFQVNHLAPFTMVYMMREAYKNRGSGRIIFVNSEGHRFALGGVHLDDLDWRKHRYTGLKSYGAAKTAQLLTMIDLTDYFRGSGVTVIAMHPGNVATGIGDDNDEKYRRFKEKRITPNARSPRISGTALYYLGLSEEQRNRSGLFYNLTNEERP
ncbi:MAG: SDR family NAD(P)-dependent oxidoreductase, partial [Spirochaetales bacterium]|nr:SDR family NAD(P)-dependent oxidoreductase [Spirochaetales bacterium]